MRYTNSPIPSDRKPLSKLGILAMIVLIACESGLFGGLVAVSHSWRYWPIPVGCLVVGWLSLEILCLPLAYRKDSEEK